MLHRARARLCCRVAFAENESADKLKIADRLSYPEILAVFGLLADPETITLSLKLPNGRSEVTTIHPLPVQSEAAGPILKNAFRDNMPLHLSDTESHYHARYLPAQNMVYVAINEIGNAESGPSLVEFIGEQVALAEQKNARLVIDLRHNFGGDGSYNRGIVLNLVQSDAINQYGRSFVLTGRRTFSAAQMLLNELEQYSRAIFVGEPSGSRPDHFGDSKQQQLEHSGLTLRVSSLHWSSWMANDGREATIPLIPAPWTSAAYFSGADPALEAIAALPAALSDREVLALAFATGDEYSIYRLLHNMQTSPDFRGPELADDLLAIGRENLAAGKSDIARLTFLYGRYYFPDRKEFDEALKRLAGD